jgi:serine/threonine protein phosphatase PrpC
MDDNVRAIVLGSDGIFEVLNNAVIMAVVQKHYAKRNAEGAAEE